ncbi:MAG: HAMP domain-containing histidine kinase [Bacteroidales bacterium]|nr:HAMP domain-containing histidine kinase [Bacteroidales bacterium]
MKRHLKWIALLLLVIMAVGALWYVHHMANQIRETEVAKIRMWANAVSQRASIVDASQQFFEQATLDEHRKMEIYTRILQSFNDPDMRADMQFSLSYVNYIVDSSKTPLIITTTSDSIITVPQELRGMKLQGDLLEEYSQNPPFTYSIWGIPLTLYYKESAYHTQLRQVIDDFSSSFVSDITNNAVLVPVIVVDSTMQKILAMGNIDTASVDTPSKLSSRIHDMANDNAPIEIKLFGNNKALVFYETTPLLKTLQWMPSVYFFIVAVLLFVTYNLFRTTRSMEQNRVWVGMAKETAHQLGTPISSLLAWTQYLRGKTLTEAYCDEMEKDLQRLSTITHRFSKIGATPELKEEDVKEVTIQSVTYLQSRVSKKVSFSVSFPEGESFIAPLNSYLFEWVVENLCKNAVDAMEGEGNITIVGSQNARNIFIDVSDNGKGMSTTLQKHIFDSGFTTKTRGWGLGLPLARRIINQYHKGRLYLKYSIPGQGTMFRIVLKKKH